MAGKYNLLTLEVFDTSKYGKRTPRYLEITDTHKEDRWGGKPQRIETYQFILDCTVREMVLTKDRIESLRCMPEFIYKDEIVTDLLLPDFLEDLQRLLGEFNFTEERGLMERGSLEYFHEFSCLTDID